MSVQPTKVPTKATVRISEVTVVNSSLEAVDSAETCAVNDSPASAAQATKQPGITRAMTAAQLLSALGEDRKGTADDDADANSPPAKAIRGKTESPGSALFAFFKLFVGVDKAMEQAMGNLNLDLTGRSNHSAAEMRAIRMIQQHFRLREAVFSCFGPSLFSMHSGAKASYGKISFSPSLSPRHFITVSETVSVGLLATFMSKYWHLARPEVLITVTGGAQDFSLTPSQLNSFETGLNSAAKSTNAWIISAGSDAGVMKIVGKALRTYKSSLPLIGIFSWGVTNGRESMGNCAGQTLPYAAEAASRNGAPLNPDHTHFVLVDNGKSGGAAWGGEIKVRAALETHTSETKKIPLVQLVVQGGPGTLSTVRATAEAGEPIVILTDSGGAATAIYEYVSSGALSPAYSKFEGQLEHLKRIKQVHEETQGNLLTFFQLESGQDLSKAMLTAILKMAAIKSERQREASSPRDGGEGSFDVAVLATEKSFHLKAEDDRKAKLLTLAVNWDRPEILQDLLANEASPGAQEYVESEVASPAERALQRAFELRRVRIVRQLMDFAEAGKMCRNVMMAKLFVVASEFDEDDHRFCEHNSKLKRFLIEHDNEVRNSKLTQTQQYELYHEFARPFYESISWMLSEQVIAQENIGPEDLFFWATIMGNDSLCDLLWYKCQKPVHVALLGALICKVIAERSQGYARSSMEQRSAKMQNMANDLLEHASDIEAKDIVALKLVDGKQYQLLDLALHGKMKKFLSHRHCMRHMDDEWRGGHATSKFTLRADFAPMMKELVLNLVFPCLLLDFFSKKASRSSVALSDITMKARAVAAAKGADERKRAITASTNSGLVQARDEAADGVRALTKGSPGSRRRITATRALSVGLSREHTRQLSVSIKRFQRGIKQNMRNPFKKHASPDDFDNAAKFLQMSRLTSFYNVPIVKFTLRAITHTAWLCLYTAIIVTRYTEAELTERVIVEEKNPEFGGPHRLVGLDVAWLIFHLGFFFDQRHMDLKQAQHRQICSNSWWRLWLLLDVLFVTSLSCFVATFFVVPGIGCVNLYRTYQTLLAFNVLIVTVLMLPYFVEWRDFGILVIIWQEMITDIQTWSLLFFVFLLGFALCFAGFEQAGFYVQPELDDGVNATAANSFTSVYGAFWAPFWIMYGDVQLENYKSMTESPTGWMVWFYSLLGSVVSVNLLVAMFTSTFDRVKDNSEAEYVYQRYMRIFEYRHILTMAPPPVNLPWTIFEICIVKIFRCRGPYSEPVPPQQDLCDGSQLLPAYLARINQAEQGTTEMMVKALAEKMDRVEKRLREAHDETSIKFGALEAQMASMNELLRP